MKKSISILFFCLGLVASRAATINGQSGGGGGITDLTPFVASGLDASLPGTLTAGGITTINFGADTATFTAVNTGSISVTNGATNCIIVALSDETTTLTTSAIRTFRFGFACSLVAIRAQLNTVSSSGLPTFDVKRNGTSLFTTLCTIDANEKTSVTAATPSVLTSNPIAIADDDEVVITCTVAGTGAKGPKVTLEYTRATL